MEFSTSCRYFHSNTSIDDSLQLLWNFGFLKFCRFYFFRYKTINLDHLEMIGQVEDLDTFSFFLFLYVQHSNKGNILCRLFKIQTYCINKTFCDAIHSRPPMIDCDERRMFSRLSNNTMIIDLSALITHSLDTDTMDKASLSAKPIHFI